mmetsp:Transcript_5290/g.11582  ORF Transcript_5290/g.11582 Transcript_5290/m.11582 type:complete len:238 (+) Transcript_5290:31-744(+)
MLLFLPSHAVSRPAFLKRGPCATQTRLFTARIPACKSDVENGAQVDALSRRDVLSSAMACNTFFLGIQLCTQPASAAAPAASGDWSSPGLNVPEDKDTPKFYKTSSGVKVQELSSGSSAGAGAKEGDLVLLDYVLRRSNGYFIYGTIEGVSFQPKDVPVGPVALRLGDPKVVLGLQEVLLGMRQGQKRRALVPPEVGYVDCTQQEPQPPTFATRRQLQNHCKEPLLFEVQVLRITPA